MDDLWNLWDLKPPPVCTVKTLLHVKEITELNAVAFDALKTLNDLNHFDKEAGILSRILYKNKRIFRHDKGMQFLVKINQCLKRYLKLGMSEVISTFKQSLPFKFNPGVTHAYLPTKQMLKWILLKLQAFSQIFVRLINLTKEVGVSYLRRLCLGWNLHFSLTIFALTARILVTSKYLVKKSIEWYNSMYKYLPYLEETSDYLPEYNFPKNLTKWLGPVDLSPLKKKTFIDEIFEFIDLTEIGEEEDDSDIKLKTTHKNFLKSFFNTEIINIDSDVEEVVEETKEEKKGVKRGLEISQPEDLGVPVNVKKKKTLDSDRPGRKDETFNYRKRPKWQNNGKNNFKYYDKGGEFKRQNFYKNPRGNRGGFYNYNKRKYYN